MAYNSNLALQIKKLVRNYFDHYVIYNRQVNQNSLDVNCLSYDIIEDCYIWTRQNSAFLNSVQCLAVVTELLQDSEKVDDASKHY